MFVRSIIIVLIWFPSIDAAQEVDKDELAQIDKLFDGPTLDENNAEFIPTSLRFDDPGEACDVDYESLLSSQVMLVTRLKLKEGQSGYFERLVQEFKTMNAKLKQQHREIRRIQAEYSLDSVTFTSSEIDRLKALLRTISAARESGGKAEVVRSYASWTLDNPVLAARMARNFGARIAAGTLSEKVLASIDCTTAMMEHIERTPPEEYQRLRELVESQKLGEIQYSGLVQEIDRVAPR